MFSGNPPFFLLRPSVTAVTHAPSPAGRTAGRPRRQRPRDGVSVIGARGDAAAGGYGKEAGSEQNLSGNDERLESDFTAPWSGVRTRVGTTFRPKLWKVVWRIK